MRIEVFNYSKSRTLSPLLLKKWIQRVIKELKKRKIKNHLLGRQLAVAFITEKKMKALNKELRKKNKVTDVLSFHSDDKKYLGELALCPRFIKKKAGKIPVREKTYYLALHGLLHLLGFEHERGGKSAEKMYRLQDDIFNRLWKK